MKIAESALELVGHTPLVRLHKIAVLHGSENPVVAKLERFNPAGSAKDRVALRMIEDAERCGALKPGALIIEPTSGNTGVGLAMAAACKGYPLVLTMPASMSVERRALLTAMGAQIVLTDATLGMSGAVSEAEELMRQHPGAFMPSQFDNPSNPAAHETTAEEIWADTEGKVDVFVATVGTGGTACGTGRVLKSHKPGVRVVTVEPAESPLLSGGKAGPHGIQGIGAGFVPDILDTGIYDEIIPVKDEDAFTYGRLMGKKEGVLVGISSGAALAAAVELAKREENAGKQIVVLMPDTGDRYLSTKLFAADED